MKCYLQKVMLTYRTHLEKTSKLDSNYVSEKVKRKTEQRASKTISKHWGAERGGGQLMQIMQASPLSLILGRSRQPFAMGFGISGLRP